MRTDDLGPLWHAASVFVVFDGTMETFWLNAMASRYFRGGFRDALIDQIRSGAKGGIDVELAAGQSANVAARLEVAGEVFRGYLRRISDGRLLLEVESRDSPAVTFVSHTRRMQEMKRERDRARRQTLDQIAARERVRLAAIDIAGIAVEPINALHRALEALDDANRRGSAGLDAEIAEIRRRLVESRLQIYEVKALVEGNFLSEARDAIAVRPLLGTVIRERFGTLLRTVGQVRIGEIPEMYGSRYLARRFLRHMLDCLAPKEDGAAACFSLRAKVRFGTVLVTAEAGPATFSVAEHARRDIAGEIMQLMARSQGWDASWVQNGDGSAVVRFGAPSTGAFGESVEAGDI